MFEIDIEYRHVLPSGSVSPMGSQGGARDTGVDRERPSTGVGDFQGLIAVVRDTEMCHAGHDSLSMDVAVSISKISRKIVVR